MQWYTLALIAFFFGGIQRFLFKVAVERKFPTKAVSLIFTSTIALLGLLAAIITSETFPTNWHIFAFAGIYGVGYASLATFRYKAMKYLPVVICYPLLQASTVMVVLFSLAYFKDVLSIYQVMGIILALLVVMVLLRPENGLAKPITSFYKGLALLGVAVFALAFTSSIGKFVALLTQDILWYTALAFGMAAITISVIPARMINRQEHISTAQGTKKDMIRLAMLAGVVFFTSFMAGMRAMATGPLSLVSVIYSLSLVLVIALSVLIYKEQLTGRRLVGIVLSVVSLILLKF